MLTTSEREAFQRAIRSLLRPIVRELVAKGIPYPALDRIVRDIYVETAVRDFSLPFKQPTDSRVSLVTGLHRKEVARLRRRGSDLPLKVSAAGSIASRVIGRWRVARGYVNADRRPRVIAYESGTARSPSFVRLVRELGIDVPPRSVLDELVRSGAVELVGDGKLRLNAGVLIPAGDIEAKLPILASDPAELFATIAHNLDAPEAAWLQRKVDYDNIGSDALAELREAAKQAGAEFIRAANALLASRDRDRNPRAPGGRRSRVVLGTYYFECEAKPASETEPSSKERQAKPARGEPARRATAGSRGLPATKRGSRATKPGRRGERST